MSSRISSRRAVAVCLALVFAVGACAATGAATGSSDDGTGPPPKPSGASTSSGPGADGGGPATPSCTPDPTCEREICQCPGGSFFATSGVCRVQGTCDFDTACAAACGAPVTNGLLEKPCTSAFECATSEPNISCACTEGFGENANAACTNGYCSDAPQDACPAACASEGGWQGCASSADCAPLFCDCSDGKIPVVPSACNGGSCEAAAAACPAACTSHGGFTGGTTTTPDAGPPGLKDPGASCAKGSECKPFDCSCKDGSKFTNNQDCEGGVCASQADTCSLSCFSDGGWTGT